MLIRQRARRSTQPLGCTVLTLRQIRSEVERLAKLIGATSDNLPTYGRESSRDFGYPHVEIDQKLYHYVVIERGEVVTRKSSALLEDLLYWIFESATSNMAFSYELEHR